MNEGRRARWQELSKSECFALLARERLGRVAVVDDLGPVVFPVNFVLDRHMVVFRTDEGTKLDAACRAAGSRSRSMGPMLWPVPAGVCTCQAECRHPREL